MKNEIVDVGEQEKMIANNFYVRFVLEHHVDT